MRWSKDDDKGQAMIEKTRHTKQMVTLRFFHLLGQDIVLEIGDIFFNFVPPPTPPTPFILFLQS